MDINDRSNAADSRQNEQLATASTVQVGPTKAGDERTHDYSEGIEANLSLGDGHSKDTTNDTALSPPEDPIYLSSGRGSAVPGILAGMDAIDRQSSKTGKRTAQGDDFDGVGGLPTPLARGETGSRGSVKHQSSQPPQTRHAVSDMSDNTLDAVTSANMQRAKEPTASVDQPDGSYLHMWPAVIHGTLREKMNSEMPDSWWRLTPEEMRYMTMETVSEALLEDMGRKRGSPHTARSSIIDAVNPQSLDTREKTIKFLGLLNRVSGQAGLFPSEFATGPSLPDYQDEGSQK